MTDTPHRVKHIDFNYFYSETLCRLLPESCCANKNVLANGQKMTYTIMERCVGALLIPAWNLGQDQKKQFNQSNLRPLHCLRFPVPLTSARGCSRKSSLFSCRLDPTHVDFVPRVRGTQPTSLVFCLGARRDRPPQFCLPGCTENVLVTWSALKQQCLFI